MITQQQRQRAIAIKAQREALIVAMEQKEQALEQDMAQIIVAARAGLTPIPVQDDIWNRDRRYIVGDTATDGGILYEAIRYSKRRLPSASPNHWQVFEPKADSSRRA